jgi:hypothetical protein
MQELAETLVSVRRIEGIYCRQIFIAEIFITESKRSKRHFLKNGPLISEKNNVRLQP